MSLTSYRAAPPRGIMFCLWLAKRALGLRPHDRLIWGRHRREMHNCVLTRFGSDLLSHVLRRSTIGATVLNGRVRDGIGCFTRAIATKP